MLKSDETGRTHFFELCDELLDEVVGGNAVVCLGLKTAGASGAINAGSGATGISMDADDCDVWMGGDRSLDFDPYED